MSFKIGFAFLGLSLSTLLFLSAGHASIDWSPRGRCQQLFIKNSPDAYDVARSIGARLHQDLPKLMQPAFFESPKFTVFFQGYDRDMTLALTHTVLPGLRRNGIPVARVEASNFFKAVDADIHKSGERNMYPEFKVLAIDSVEFDAIGFQKFRDLRVLLQARYQAGNSTILIVRGPLSTVDEKENPVIDPEFEMLVNTAFGFDFRPHFFEFSY